MMKKLRLVFGIAVLGTLTINAQQDTVLSLSLQEAVDYALENNTEIQNSKLDIEKSKKTIWETTAIGLPQVSASVGYTHIPGEIPTMEFDLSGAFTPLSIYMENFVQPSFPGAPTLEEFMAEPTDQPAESEDGGIPLAVKNSTSYGATVSQLVFSGEYIVGLQASKTFLQLSNDNLEKTILEAKENAFVSYFAILTLQNGIALMDSSIANLEIIINEMQAMQNNGYIEDTDVDQLQLTMNNLQNTRNSIKRQLEVSFYLLKLALGINVVSEVVLTDNMETVITALNLNTPPNTNFQLENNVDYKSLQTLEKVDELSLKREQSKYLPSVFAFYNYTDKTNKPDFDFTINHILGVNVDIPIFSSGMRNARIQQAKIELEKTKNSKTNFEEMILMQAEQLYNAYFNALDKYQTNLKNVELSKKIYNKTLIKYKEGLATSMELTQANNQYIEAESTLSQTTLELFSAKIAIEKLLGTL